MQDTEPSVFSSEKTRTFNHLQMSELRQHILLIICYFKTLRDPYGSPALYN